MESILLGALFGLVVAYLFLTVHEQRKAIDVLTDAHNANCESIRILRMNLIAMREAGPIGCEVCGANHFVHIEDEWLCKECRQPAPADFVAQLKAPESRTTH